MAEYTDYYSGAGTGISAVTGTTTGTVLDVSMREQVGIICTCDAFTSGSGTFTVDGSNDGTNFVTGLAFVDATATASITYVTSKALTSATSAAIYLPLYPFKLIRIKCTVSGTGTYSATMEAQG